MFYLGGDLLIWETNSGVDWLYIPDFKGKKIQTIHGLGLKIFWGANHSILEAQIIFYLKPIYYYKGL